MSVAWITLKKELASYLYSPVGYVIALLLYAFSGWFEVVPLVWVAGASGYDPQQFLAGYMSRVSGYLLLVLVPAILTMRCFAEERRTGSLEVLLTAPVRDVEVVVGKWAAALVFTALLWLPSLWILWILQGEGYLGVDFPLGPLFSAFFGVLLVSAMLLAVGCFTSSLTDNQLLASLSAMLVSAVMVFGVKLYLVGDRWERATSADDAGSWFGWVRDNVLDPTLRQIDVVDHLQAWFFRGVVNTGHVVFYVAGTAFFLFLATRSLEARRWR